MPHNTAPEASTQQAPAQPTTAATSATPPPTPTPAPEAPKAQPAPAVEMPGELAQEVKTCTCDVAELELTADTKINTLVSMHPLLRDHLKEIHPDFSAISNPILWNIMKYKTTIGKMSERSGMPVEEIIAKLRTLIAEIGS